MSFTRALPAALLACLIICAGMVTAQQAPAEQPAADKPKAPLVTDFATAQALAAERNQYILIDFWRPG